MGFKASSHCPMAALSFTQTTLKPLEMELTFSFYKDVQIIILMTNDAINIFFLNVHNLIGVQENHVFASDFK